VYDLFCRPPPKTSAGDVYLSWEPHLLNLDRTQKTSAWQTYSHTANLGLFAHLTRQSGNAWCCFFQSTHVQCFKFQPINNILEATGFSSREASEISRYLFWETENPFSKVVQFSRNLPRLFSMWPWFQNGFRFWHRSLLRHWSRLITSLERPPFVGIILGHYCIGVHETRWTHTLKSIVMHDLFRLPLRRPL